MTYDVFFWYVFPALIAAGAVGWVLYDRHAKDRLHPGE